MNSFRNNRLRDHAIPVSTAGAGGTLAFTQE